MKLENILREIMEAWEEEVDVDYIAKHLRKRRAEVASALYELPTMKERMDSGEFDSTHPSNNSSVSSDDIPESFRGDIDTTADDPDQGRLFQ